MTEEIKMQEQVPLGQSNEFELCYFCNEPVTRFNGLNTESLCNHHITYIPEVKVLVHRGCHTKYHRTHPNHPTNPETECRKRFIEGLGEDVICYFCSEPITELNGMDSKSLLIHSLDGNNSNWDPANKVPSHHGCHTTFHHRGKVISEEAKDRFRGDGNPMRRPEVVAKFRGVKRPDQSQRMRTHNPMKNPEAVRKAVRTRRKLYGSSYFKDSEALGKVVSEGHMRRSPEEKSRSSKETWDTRRERYGPSGCREGKSNRKHTEKTKEKIRKRVKQNWIDLKKKYGPSGRKDPEAFSRTMTKANKQAWRTRRKRYGPTGMKPK